MIKLIAIDLDGTLLRDDKTISEANAATIRRAVEAGIEVVICTGRPIEGIQFAL
ncbi:HAD hydrolase family protein, partial [Streptococcus anginosus]